MRIQHNIPAMNSYRNYTANNKSVAKNLEKLSSGYRINRAGDDAAGLAISEKMRAQVTGLKAAQKNAKDGISLVQTAEGALTEVHSMLNRMVELADQSANGTYDNETDRVNLQKEITQLKSEIDRIADSTNFNGIKLLDGSLSSKGATSAASGVTLDGNFTGVGVADATKWKMTSAATTLDKGNLTAQGEKVEINFTFEENGVTKSKSLSLTLGKDKDGNDVLVGGSGQEYSITGGVAATLADGDMTKALNSELRKSGLENSFSFTSTLGTKAAIVAEAKEGGVNGAKMLSITETVYNKDGTVKTAPASAALTKTTDGADAYNKGTIATLYNTAGTNEKDAVVSVNGKKYMMAADGTNVSGVSSDVTVVFGADLENAAANMASKISQDTGLSVTATALGVFSFKSGTSSVGGKGGLTLQIGDTSEKFNQISVSVGDMHAKSLGINGVDIATQDGAAAAIDVLKNAINQVSSTRGDLGATQNRLDHTINNLSVMTENIQDAEASIRDVDVAEEMMAYTKNNILVQSSQAMLAQANQLPQGVLQLLQ